MNVTNRQTDFGGYFGPTFAQALRRAHGGTGSLGIDIDEKVAGKYPPTGDFGSERGARRIPKAGRDAHEVHLPARTSPRDLLIRIGSDYGFLEPVQQSRTYSTFRDTNPQLTRPNPGKVVRVG